MLTQEEIANPSGNLATKVQQFLRLNVALKEGTTTRNKAATGQEFAAIMMTVCQTKQRKQK